MIRCRTLVVFCIACAVFMTATLQAGGLDAPAAPSSPGSAIYSLTDIYNRLLSGAAGSKRPGGFTEPSSGPTAGSMHTVDEIMGKAPAIDANGATAAAVLAGKSFWGLATDSWGPTTGTMANIGTQNFTPGTASQTVTQGYHNGSGVVAGDANLVTGNIKAGATIFGVSGNNNVVDTSSGDATAGEILPGRKAWVGGTEVTGAMPAVTTNVTPGAATLTIPAGWYSGLASVTGDASLVSANIKAGVTIFGVVGSPTVVDTAPATALATDVLLNKTAFVNGTLLTGARVGGVTLKGGFLYHNKPRWYVNNDGTITDCKTGLVWLSDIDHVSHPFIASTGAPVDVMRYLYSLRHGNPFWLTDNSQPGDWDMPTRAELLTLMELDEYNEQIGSGSRGAFDNPWTSTYYWTSTPVPDGPGLASPDKVYIIEMSSGVCMAEDKLALSAVGHYVWPIRRIHRK